MKYEVRIINPEGPGRKLFTGSLDACRDHIAESGCAYDYSLGVAVRRVEDDHYDCGENDMTRNPCTLREETTCHACGKETIDLYAMTQRSDGTWFERTDGSFGESDSYVCEDCYFDGEFRPAAECWD